MIAPITERVYTVDYALSEGGLMVHSHTDWPCACCRPREISDSSEFCLCIRCAHAMISAAGAGFGESRELLDELTDAVALLEGAQWQNSRPNPVRFGVN